MDFRLIVRALSRCQCLLLRTVLPIVLVASRHSARGSGKFEECTVRTCAPCRQSLFERPAGGVLQVPERQKKYCQFGGFAYPKTLPHSPFLPRRGGRPRAAPRKGFLNRRFKRVFAYFCRAAKVGQGSGGGQPTGYQRETIPRRAERGKEAPTSAAPPNSTHTADTAVWLQISSFSTEGTASPTGGAVPSSPPAWWSRLRDTDS